MLPSRPLDTSQAPKKIAFFDVDHTLIDGNSGYFSSLRLVHHGILKKRRVLQALYYSLASLIYRQDVEKIYGIAIKDMAGNSLERILAIGKECFDQDILKRFFSESLELLEKHRAQGDILILLSSGPYMVIKYVHDHCHTHDAYCMGTEIENKILTDKLQTPLCHAEGKIHYAREACNKYNIDLKECYFYTDHYTDIPLLEEVGHPVLINPDRILARKGHKEGWPIIRVGKRKKV